VKLRIAVGFTTLMMLLVGSDSAVAQETTGTPIVELVSPQLCIVAPRTIESLNAIVEALPSDGTDVRVPVRFGPGEGDPADELTVQDVTKVAVEMAACLNAGDVLRLYALFSDDGLIPALVPDDLFQAEAATPAALPEDDQFATPTVWDVRVQEDGRVTALTELDGEVALITFVWNGDRYLIDLFDDQIASDATPPIGA
jgi:hypothetical protein